MAAYYPPPSADFEFNQTYTGGVFMKSTAPTSGGAAASREEQLRLWLAQKKQSSGGAGAAAAHKSGGAKSAKTGGRRLSLTKMIALGGAARQPLVSITDKTHAQENTDSLQPAQLQSQSRDTKEAPASTAPTAKPPVPLFGATAPESKSAPAAAAVNRPITTTTTAPPATKPKVPVFGFVAPSTKPVVTATTAATGSAGFDASSLITPTARAGLPAQPTTPYHTAHASKLAALKAAVVAATTPVKAAAPAPTAPTAPAAATPSSSGSAASAKLGLTLEEKLALWKLQKTEKKVHDTTPVPITKRKRVFFDAAPATTLTPAAPLVTTVNALTAAANAKDGVPETVATVKALAGSSFQPLNAVILAAKAHIKLSNFAMGDTLLASILALPLTPNTPTTPTHLTNMRLIAEAQRSAQYWICRVDCAVALNQWEVAIDWFEAAKMHSAQPYELIHSAYEKFLAEYAKFQAAPLGGVSPPVAARTASSAAAGGGVSEADINALLSDDDKTTTLQSKPAVAVPETPLAATPMVKAPPPSVAAAAAGGAVKEVSPPSASKLISPRAHALRALVDTDIGTLTLHDPLDSALSMDQPDVIRRVSFGDALNDLAAGSGSGSDNKRDSLLSPAHKRRIRAMGVGAGHSSGDEDDNDLAADIKYQARSAASPGDDEAAGSSDDERSGFAIAPAPASAVKPKAATGTAGGAVGGVGGAAAAGGNKKEVIFGLTLEGAYVDFAKQLLQPMEHSSAQLDAIANNAMKMAAAEVVADPVKAAELAAASEQAAKELTERTQQLQAEAEAAQRAADQKNRIAAEAAEQEEAAIVKRWADTQSAMAKLSITTADDAAPAASAEPEPEAADGSLTTRVTRVLTFDSVATPTAASDAHPLLPLATADGSALPALPTVSESVFPTQSGLSPMAKRVRVTKRGGEDQNSLTGSSTASTTVIVLEPVKLKSKKTASQQAQDSSAEDGPKQQSEESNDGASAGVVLSPVRRAVRHLDDTASSNGAVVPTTHAVERVVQSQQQIKELLAQTNYCYDPNPHLRVRMNQSEYESATAATAPTTASGDAGLTASGDVINVEELAHALADRLVLQASTPVKPTKPTPALTAGAMSVAAVPESPIASAPNSIASPSPIHAASRSAQQKRLAFRDMIRANIRSFNLGAALNSAAAPTPVDAAAAPAPDFRDHKHLATDSAVAGAAPSAPSIEDAAPGANKKPKNPKTKKQCIQCGIRRSVRWTFSDDGLQATCHACHAAAQLAKVVVTAPPTATDARDATATSEPLSAPPPAQVVLSRTPSRMGTPSLRGKARVAPSVFATAPAPAPTPAPVVAAPAPVSATPEPVFASPAPKPKRGAKKKVLPAVPLFNAPSAAPAPADANANSEPVVVMSAPTVPPPRSSGRKKTHPKSVLSAEAIADATASATAAAAAITIAAIDNKSTPAIAAAATATTTVVMEADATPSKKSKRGGKKAAAASASAATDDLGLVTVTIDAAATGGTGTTPVAVRRSSRLATPAKH